MESAKEIVGKFLAALGGEDWKGARKCLHENVSFRGPLDTFEKADSYIDALKKLHPIVKKVDMKKMFVDGSDVCILYDLVTNTPAGVSFVAEWFQIRDDKIASIRAVFDARPFAALFGK